MRTRALQSCLFYLLVFSGSHIYGQAPNTPTIHTTIALPLWGDLSPGSYRVGFRRLYRFDASRTWRVTRNYEGKFSPDLNGRPVEINVWYPGASGRAGKQMHWGDYAEQSSPKAFNDFNAAMNKRNRQNVEGAVSAMQVPELLSTAMNAFVDLPAATGRFPTVLYFGGLSADINSNAVLGEFLASHGYIVASISLLGPTDQQTSPSRTATDIEATVRDMEFAWSVFSEESNVDKTRLAVMGHSIGGIEAILFAMRNSNVAATIGLDGTYGFRDSTKVLTDSFGYRPNTMRAAFLDLRRAQGERGAVLDLTPIESFRYSDRTLVTTKKMRHSDFTIFAMIADKFQTPITSTDPPNGWNRNTAKLGYQQVCRIVLAFLNGQLNGDSKATAALSDAVSHAEGGDLKHEDAGLVPPSPMEMLGIENDGGIGEAEGLLKKICGNENMDTCVDEGKLNAFGYELLGLNRAKDAVVVFEIAAWSHPRSANAQDSLADAYLAVGDKESAKKAVERALAYAPTDPALDTQSKASFISNETARLQNMN